MNKHLFRMKGRMEKTRARYGKPGRKCAGNGFQCAHCHGYVTLEPGLSGVQSRNHCPYCLWSRHLDLYAAGDRLSACKSPMQPIGLTVKATGKKYGSGQGELLLIHMCTECESLSINRIAADDVPQRVFSVFEDSFCLDALMHTRLETDGITILTLLDKDTVHAQLFGYVSDLAGIFSLTGPAAVLVERDDWLNETTD